VSAVSAYMFQQFVEILVRPYLQAEFEWRDARFGCAVSKEDDRGMNESKNKGGVGDQAMLLWVLPYVF
jgi:hypothetical protein